ARAVGSQQPEALAAPHLEVEAVDGGHVVVALDEPAHLDGGRGRRGDRRSRRHGLPNIERTLARAQTTAREGFAAPGMLWNFVVAYPARLTLDRPARPSPGRIGNGMGQRLDFIQQANAAYLEDLYARFRQDPDSVPEEWALFFAGFELG